MSTRPDDDLEAIRKMLTVLVDALDAEPSPEDAAGVELLALPLQAPFTWPDASPELARELPAALAKRRDALAADLLAAIERLAPEPLAGLAADQRVRLEAEGVLGAHADGIGRAVIAEAWIHTAPEGEIWLALLRRHDGHERQPLVLFVEQEPCGAVIVGGSAGAPGQGDAVREQLVESGAGTGDRVDEEALLNRLRSALEHMERHAAPLASDAAEVLPLLERALTGRVGRLPRPLGVDPDEDAAREHAEALVDAFAASLESAGDGIAPHAPFVAHCMLDWKVGYGDGDVTRWTLGDLRELMLDWLPRKVTLEDETIAVTGDAIVAFLRFLAAEELLDAPVPLASLEAAVERLRPRCQQALRDPRRWGLAKATAAQMAAEGVDLAEPEAVEAWIHDFNSRPHSEREPILGPLTTTRATPPARPGRRRAKRKAARRARRNNRRPR